MSAVGTPETLPQQPPLSRRKEKKAVKMAAKLKLAGSVDVRVQHTNDDSVVSKRSAVKLKYLTDDILPYFVTKPARRSPLINRGYYLRMKVMYELIGICCTHLRQECGSECPVQVISLGAGYDTTAVRFITQQGKDGSSTLQEPICFYDVDFPAVMQAKAALLESMAEKLPDVVLNPKDAICPLRSPIYTALGVDLREASTVLVPQLQAFSDSFSVDYPTIIYAECVTQYMPSEETAALVGFLARTFPKAMFMAYDQLQPADSFGKMMCHSLRQKNSPLMGIEACPSGESMIQRALSQGMKDAAFTNFYDLSRHVLQGDERARVDALEPFDEIEEWSEMCEHYGITVATTLANLDGMLRANPFLKRKEDPPQLHDEENLPLVAQLWPTGRFGFEGWGHGAVQSETLSNGDVLLISFGGFQAKGGGHQRVNQVFVHSFFEGELHVAQSEADMVPNLIFHSVSRIAPFQYVVFGGRTNPSNASNTAYLLTIVVPRSISSTSSIVAMWKELRVDVGCVAPSPRFRHVAVATSPSELLVIGGKSPSGSLLNDVWRGTLSTSTGTVTWKEESLRGVDAPIPPMCSAAAVLSPAGDAVIISGGLLANDHCSKAMYRLQLSSMELVRYDLMLDGRCSHTMTPCVIDGSSFLLILGGSGDAPKSTTHIEEVAVLVDFPTLREAKLVALPPDAPTWSRHSCVALGPQGVLAVIGGGFTCFSFGTFSAKPHILRIGHNPGPLPHVQKKQLSSSLTQPSGSLAALLPIPRESVVEQEYTNARVLEAIHNGSQPVVFRHTPFGACVEKWKDPAYLEEAERGTMVSVHVAQGNPHLDFVRKNFAFRHVPFEELVGHVVKSQAHFKQHQTVPEEVMYYRSIAGHMMSERANFWKDFRTLQADFSLPGEAGDFIQARVHQSCLRINAAPLQLWTHYDTCDNVLCQIVGRKRVVLFPPSAYNDLYIKGSSSAVINIDDPDLLQYPRFVEAHKSAVEVVLEPGDMLFFPSMWFHHCTTLDDDYSVSVNVFFRRFGEEDYDKKDLYGNKDIPACTSMREAIVADVKNRVARLRLDGSGNEVPPEYTEFALREAIQDLEEYVESMAAARRVQRLQHTASSLASQTTK